MDNQQFIAPIKMQKEVSPAYFLISIYLPPDVKKPGPGEFFMVKVGRDNYPLLRRPLSLHRMISGDTLQFLYRVKGKGTGLLSKKMEGDKLDILGPLGKGFLIPSDMKEAILVAGGIGIAPLFSLAEELKNKEISVKFFIGGKSKKDILCEDELRSLGIQPFISAEDGSRGRRGLVTELLEDYLKTVHGSRLPGRQIGFTVHGEQSVVNGSRIYACGPKPMLKKVSEIAGTYSCKCHVSLEERMACGVGACLGCAVKIRVQRSNPPSPPFAKGGKGGINKSKIQNPKSEIYKMVCKDGPVFNAEEIDWDG
ncbi:MAG: dihydroorotate dehydrogenase electron transfer subunit [Nitrospirota bacterium]